ncbi:hypothetical protein L6452_38416 [Arctium lappa]|uniref:Uncharacterized protein n=1 Tax=Arctium lappa TaxID=4217 RepID=A0ACB8Y6E1_ARCLA|nr:hypothetical protein L6452_38416 [Arctium lappa]
MTDLSSHKRKGRTSRSTMKINKTYRSNLSSTANNQKLKTTNLSDVQPTKPQTNEDITPLTPSTEKESNVYLDPACSSSYQYSDDGEMMVDDDGMHCFIENMDQGGGVLMDQNGVLLSSMAEEEKEKEKMRVMMNINEEEMFTQNAISDGGKEGKKIESEKVELVGGIRSSLLSTSTVNVGDGKQVVDGDWEWNWDFDFDFDDEALGLGIGSGVGEEEDDDNILLWPWEESTTTDNIAAWLLS